MVSSKSRPINLKLSSIKFPITAISSILHRISGVCLFFGTILCTYLLDKSLTDETGFGDARALIANPLMSILVWGFLCALGYHFSAGVKHLIMEFGHAESLEAGTLLSVASIVLGLILAVVSGVWLWFPIY